VIVDVNLEAMVDVWEKGLEIIPGKHFRQR
jgi:hypothetical protein